jgi:hypothetical protein
VSSLSLIFHLSLMALASTSVCHCGVRPPCRCPPSQLRASRRSRMGRTATRACSLPRCALRSCSCSSAFSPVEAAHPGPQTRCGTSSQLAPASQLPRRRLGCNSSNHRRHSSSPRWRSSTAAACGCSPSPAAARAPRILSWPPRHSRGGGGLPGRRPLAAAIPKRVLRVPVSMATSASLPLCSTCLTGASSRRAPRRLLARVPARRKPCSHSPWPPRQPRQAAAMQRRRGRRPGALGRGSSARRSVPSLHQLTATLAFVWGAQLRCNGVRGTGHRP